MSLIFKFDLYFSKMHLYTKYELLTQTIIKYYINGFRKVKCSKLDISNERKPTDQYKIEDVNIC